MDLTDTCRTSYPKTTEYTSIHATFSMTDQMSGYKISLRKFSKIEYLTEYWISYILNIEYLIEYLTYLLYTTVVKLEINTRGKAESSHMWKLNNTLEELTGQRKIKGETKVSWDHKNGITKYQNLWDVAKAVLRSKFIAINTQ